MLYILDRYEQGRAILTNENPKALDYYGDTHIEQLDGLLSYDFSVPANHASASEIISEGYVLLRDLDDKLIEFKIKRLEEYDDNGITFKKVYTENAAISDIRGEIVRPIKLVAASLKQAAEHALKNTGWQLGNYDSSAGLQDFDFMNYPTGLAALTTIREIYDLEIAYRVEYDGAIVRARYVDLVKQRGSDTSARFEYGKNLTGVKREEDSTDLVTALVGIGKANEDGTRVTFTDAEYDYGYFKPKGQDWVGNDEARALYSKNGKHIFGVYEDTNAVAWTQLLSGATKELERRSKPRMTYELSLVLLERLTGYSASKVRLGDRILVIDTNFTPALILKARVIELIRSYTDPTQDSALLGEFVPVFVDTSAELADFKKFVNSKQGLWDAPSETITKSHEEPTEKKLDMLWLDLSSTPNVLKRWDGLEWQKASATHFSEVQGQITTVQIEENAVTTEQIAPDAITSTEIAQDAVTTEQIAPNAVTTLEIAENAVTTAQIAEGAVTSVEIAPVSIKAVHIEDAAIEAQKIKDGAVDAIKLKDGAVTASKLAEGAVKEGNIDAGAITEAKMKWSTHLIF